MLMTAGMSNGNILHFTFEEEYQMAFFNLDEMEFKQERPQVFMKTISGEKL